VTDVDRFSKKVLEGGIRLVNVDQPCTGCVVSVLREEAFWDLDVNAERVQLVREHVGLGRSQVCDLGDEEGDSHVPAGFASKVVEAAMQKYASRTVFRAVFERDVAVGEVTLHVNLFSEGEGC
jgi:hypothetical protein